MADDRLLPLPGSPEARERGCTCPPFEPGQHRLGAAVPLDDKCPVHGLAAGARHRAAEPGPVDTEGDIVDRASEPELRRS